MRAKHTALILTAGILLVPALSWSQFPGQGGQGGGRGGFQMDPDQLFNMAAKGRDVIVVSELDGMQKMIFDRMSSRLGLSGNEITREQFRGAMTRATEMAKSGELGGSGMSFRPAEGGSPGGFGQPGMSFGRPGGDTSDRDRRRDEYFRRLDRNEDGELEYDELSGDPIAEGLQTERSKYDVNGNGFIDPAEFKTYMLARFPSPEGGADNPGAPGAPKDGEERKRPTIIRAGNLPRDFPYAALDTDLDGQIGLYEWKNGGKKVADFLPLDLNNDGFMTVEEYYRKKKEDNASASSEYGRGAMNGGDPRMMAMGQGGNRGQGGGFGGMQGGQGGGFGGMQGRGGPGEGGGRGFGGGTPGGGFGGGTPGGGFGGQQGRGGPGEGGVRGFGGGTPGGGFGGSTPGGGFGGQQGRGGPGEGGGRGFGGGTPGGGTPGAGFGGGTPGAGFGGNGGIPSIGRGFGGMGGGTPGGAPGATQGSSGQPGGERGDRGNRGGGNRGGPGGGGESGGETPRPKGKGR